jgi:putative DeoR family transcriptional regulator (stage III sporulation protein D)
VLIHRVFPVLQPISPAYNVTTTKLEGNTMKGYIEERAVEIANYIIDNNATVRQTAKQFGISKSTVHTGVTNRNN